MKILNYEKAIQNNATVDFLLGKNIYHFPDSDWHPDLHKGSDTFYFIREYGLKYGEDKMMEQFVKDLKKSLELSVNPFEFLLISTYIYIYTKDFYEKIFSTPLQLDEQTTNLIKYHYNKLMEIYDDTDIKFKSEYDLIKKYGYNKDKLGNNNLNISIIEANANFFINNIIAKYQLIEEKFGLDLLN